MKRSKLINPNTGETKLVRLHPTKQEIFKGRMPSFGWAIKMANHSGFYTKQQLKEKQNALN